MSDAAAPCAVGADVRAPERRRRGRSGPAGAGRCEHLFIKDEGSDQIAIYGNKSKIRFLIPNLYYGGVRNFYSHGAYGTITAPIWH